MIHIEVLEAGAVAQIVAKDGEACVSERISGDVQVKQCRVLVKERPQMTNAVAVDAVLAQRELFNRRIPGKAFGNSLTPTRLQRVIIAVQINDTLIHCQTRSNYPKPVVCNLIPTQVQVHQLEVGLLQIFGQFLTNLVA